VKKGRYVGFYSRGLETGINKAFPNCLTKAMGNEKAS